MNIAVICLAGVGDGLLSVPMIKLLRKHHPQAKITVIVMYKATEEIMKAFDFIDEVKFFNMLKKGFFRSLNFIKRLRKEKYDLTIITYPANRLEYNGVFFLIGGKERIAHDYVNKRHYLLTGTFLNTKIVKQDKAIHNVLENIKLLEPLNIFPENKDLELFLPVSRNDTSFAKKFLKNKKKPVIGIHAGTGETKNLHLRRWPKEKFAALIDKLNKKYKGTVLLFGGPNEDNLKKDIKHLCKSDLTLVNDTTIMQAAALIKECDFFITNDSALMHVASAVKTPTVALFGPTDKRIVYPYGVKHEIVTKNYWCSPCYFYSSMDLSCWRKIDFECVKKITVDDVMKAVKKLNK